MFPSGPCSLLALLLPAVASATSACSESQPGLCHAEDVTSLAQLRATVARSSEQSQHLGLTSPGSGDRSLAAAGVQHGAQPDARLALAARDTGRFGDAGGGRDAAVRSGQSAGGVCVVTAAVGEGYAELGKQTAVSKIGYAEKWNYTFLQYEWASPGEFLDWCHGTSLGSRYERDLLNFNNPTVKPCVMAHALTAQGCNLAVWMDVDAVVLNWDLQVDLSWPGAVKSSSQKPYGVFGVVAAPEWMPHSVDASSIDWCLKHSPCTSFGVFQTCFNSGVFILDNSPEGLRYLAHVLDGVMESIGTKHNCSTLALNPYGADQCRDPNKDQCISGCIWELEDRGGDDALPEGVMCADPSKGPALQQVLRAYDLDDMSTSIPANTYVVNISGAKGKQKALDLLVEAFPHLKAVHAS